MKITKGMINWISTTGKGYGFTGQATVYAKKLIFEITGKEGRPFSRLAGKSVTEDQWRRLAYYAGKSIEQIEKQEFKELKPKRAKKGGNKGLRQKKREAVKRQADADFYASREWRELRVRVLEKHECKCMMCGRSPKDHGIVIHVDHILPRSKHPELSLEITNLQLLCEDCNLGKGNKYETDWRPEAGISND